MSVTPTHAYMRLAKFRLRLGQREVLACRGPKRRYAEIWDSESGVNIYCFTRKLRYAF